MRGVSTPARIRVRQLIGPVWGGLIVLSDHETVNCNPYTILMCQPNHELQQLSAVAREQTTLYTGLQTLRPLKKLFKQNLISLNLAFHAGCDTVNISENALTSKYCNLFRQTLYALLKNYDGLTLIFIRILKNYDVSNLTIIFYKNS